MTAKEALNKYFGYNEFKANQEEIIKNILEGKNILAVLPTGAGKSVCYQIPAILSKNFSIVISPLIALMKDQVDSLNKVEKISAFINSSMSFFEIEKVLQEVAFGKIKLLYVAPERLESMNFAERIKILNPEYLFVDEAHCISEWGHNFRPSYRKIKDFVEFLSLKKISGFTATATPEVVKDIITQLGLKNPQLFVKGFERDNLHLRVFITKGKKEKCLELLRNYEVPAIVYTSSRASAEEVCEYLNLNGVPCNYYHAGLTPEERRRIQDGFINDNIKVITATNAFGMGIDKSNIRLIIHFNSPGSIENYYQEIGRAGRDGKPSFAFLLFENSDVNIHNYFLSNSFPDKEIIQSTYDAICDYANLALGNSITSNVELNLNFVINYIKKDVSKAMIISALKFLEEAGYIKHLSNFQSSIYLQFLFDSIRLKNFVKKTANPKIKGLVLFLLREYGSRLFNSKQLINPKSLSEKAGLTDEELNETLEILDNMGVLSYEQLYKENISFVHPRVKSSELKLNYKKINLQYLFFQKKINSMIEFVHTRQCRFKFILNYFGENTNGYRCSRCDNCQNKNLLPDNSFDFISEVIINLITESNSELKENEIINYLKGTGEKHITNVQTSFGSLANFTSSEIKSVLFNLVSANKLMRKGGKIKLVKPVFAETTLQNSEGNNYEDNLQLFNLLKEVRKKASEKYLQAAIFICPDDILHKIVQEKPDSKTALLQIKGFSQRMYNKIGEDFLKIINNYKTKRNKTITTGRKEMPSNIQETYKLIKQGYRLPEIISLRKTDEAIISMQIETIIEYEPEIDLKNILDEQTFDNIKSESLKGYKDLRELKKRLPQEYSYGIIRIALAKLKVVS